MQMHFNKKQLNRISEIYMGIGHISLASMAIPALIDKFNWNVLILSLDVAIFFWVASLYTLKENNNE